MLKMEDGDLRRKLFLSTLPSLSSLDFTAHDLNHPLLSTLHHSTVFHPITLAKNNPKSILLLTFSAFTTQMLKGGGVGEGGGQATL